MEALERLARPGATLRVISLVGAVTLALAAAAPANAESNAVQNGEFVGSLEGWSTVVVSEGSFAGYPHIKSATGVPCDAALSAQTFLSMDVPGGADGYVQQQITVPSSSPPLTFLAWGNLEPVQVTIDAVSGSNVTELLRITPPALQSGPDGETCTGAVPAHESVNLAAFAGQTVGLRVEATSVGFNGTLTGLTDFSLAGSGTTTTTSTHSTSLRPTALHLTCTYTVATSADTCTASVADTGAPPFITPTGPVGYSDTGGGLALRTCNLQATPLSPGVASCAVEFIPPSSAIPSLTAAYAGDAQHSGSAGSAGEIVGVWGPEPQSEEAAALCGIAAAAGRARESSGSDCASFTKAMARERRDEDLRACAFMSGFGGVSALVPGGQAAAGLSALAAAYFCYDAVEQNRIYEDPPDSHWHTIVRPRNVRPPTLPALSGPHARAAGTALRKLFGALGRESALIGAMGTSINRATTAARAHNARWAGRQKRAAKRFAARAALLASQLPSLSRHASRLLAKVAGLSATISPADVASFESTVASSGVPAAIARWVKRAGAGSVLGRMRALIVAAGVPSASASLPSTLAAPSLLATYTREASALRAFSRLRP